MECAVDIQRDLARHRREHGFAPSVRIGVHGRGDTPRSRTIPARASTWQPGSARPRSGRVLASEDVLDQAGPVRFPLSEPRPLTLKGVREPVEVPSCQLALAPPCRCRRRAQASVLLSGGARRASGAEDQHE